MTLGHHFLQTLKVMSEAGQREWSHSDYENWKKLSDSLLLFLLLQIMIEFCPGGAVDATMLGKPSHPAFLFYFCFFVFFFLS